MTKLKKSRRERGTARRTTAKRSTLRMSAKSGRGSTPQPVEASRIKFYSYIRFSTPEQAEGDSE